MDAGLKLERLRSFVVRIKTKSHWPFLRHLPVHMVDIRKEKRKRKNRKSTCFMNHKGILRPFLPGYGIIIIMNRVSLMVDMYLFLHFYFPRMCFWGGKVSRYRRRNEASRRRGRRVNQ